MGDCSVRRWFVHHCCPSLLWLVSACSSPSIADVSLVPAPLAPLPEPRVISRTHDGRLCPAGTGIWENEQELAPGYIYSWEISEAPELRRSWMMTR